MKWLPLSTGNTCLTTSFTTSIQSIIVCRNVARSTLLSLELVQPKRINHIQKGLRHEKKTILGTFGLTAFAALEGEIFHSTSQNTLVNLNRFALHSFKDTPKLKEYLIKENCGCIINFVVGVYAKCYIWNISVPVYGTCGIHDKFTREVDVRTRNR